jgi:hypothetical protein
MTMEPAVRLSPGAKLRALAIALLLVLSMFAMARPAEAHSTYCGHVQHYDILNENWTVYKYGYWNGRVHMHVYDHYYHSLFPWPQTWYQHTYTRGCTT